MTLLDEHDDDLPIGRILSRREILALLGGAGVSLVLAGCGDPTPTTAAQVPSTASQATAAQPTTAAATQAASTLPPTTALANEAKTAVAATPVSSSPTATTTSTPTCVARPEETEGPYFVDEKLNRSDIRSDPTTGVVKAGLPLSITFLVSQIAANSCTALQGAQVDIWHCDAAGTYSDTNDPNWNTVGQKFLRGYQVTDASGKATFSTIYPGWYSGRAVHIHFKIRTTGSNGSAYEFTSQMFFDDTLSTQVFTQAPYNTKGTRDTLNATDSIYKNGGDQLLLTLDKTANGYSTTFGVGLDLSNTDIGKSDSAGSGGGPGGGRGTPPPTR